MRIDETLDFCGFNNRIKSRSLVGHLNYICCKWLAHWVGGVLELVVHDFEEVFEGSGAIDVLTIKNIRMEETDLLSLAYLHILSAQFASLIGINEVFEQHLLESSWSI